MAAWQSLLGLAFMELTKLVHKFDLGQTQLFLMMHDWRDDHFQMNIEGIICPNFVVSLLTGNITGIEIPRY